MKAAALGFAMTLLAGAAPGLAQGAPDWMVGYGSRIGFVATQSGAPVEGVFEDFMASIAFDPDNLAASRVEVVIEVASVNSLSKDRDEMIRSAPLFDAALWPSATFAAEGFTDLGGGRYEAAGNLTLRDVTLPVMLPFTLVTEERDGAVHAVASGELAVLRLDYGIGQGLWQDTSVVGNEVTIKIDIQASRPAL
ncbi:YceI family protein [Pelagibius litoralis]|uniref:YceI family protein n=1 Tax=Pelagibius litoralis TaxID=374515 RepID=A0A967F157_9PROT|nr:YceI family protein [Pelagibius litoralis]NIA71119.1 YceI family protein [Pelagibius litoralis]